MFQNNKSFIIAEVGQNHNGDFEQTKNYIDIFANLGADAFKFQTRDNKYLFAKEAYDKEYKKLKLEILKITIKIMRWEFLNKNLKILFKKKPG